jgi:hypothetical protein
MFRILKGITTVLIHQMIKLNPPSFLTCVLSLLFDTNSMANFLNLLHVSRTFRYSGNKVNPCVAEVNLTLLNTRTSIQSRLHFRCLVAASKSGFSLFCGFPNSPRPQLPASNSNNSRQLNPSSLLTHSLTHSPTNSSLVLFVTSRHGPHRRHRSSVAKQLLRSCWGSHEIATQPLPSNGRCFQSHYLAMAVV